VFRDPEGTHSLEQNGHPESKKNITSGTDDDYYKKRIENLNEEIKALNDELTLVDMTLFYVSVITQGVFL